VHTYAQAGDYQVRLMVVDDMNAPMQETISLTISAATSTPPVIDQFTARPNPAYTTVATTFYWQVNDPDVMCRTF
jgi:hypothetical protein